jgi:RNA recognition motif-containing protein
MGSELNKFKNKLCKRRFFVGNLPSKIKNTDLEEYFSQFGPVECAYTIKDHKTKKSKNFGYVIFQSEEILQSDILKKKHVILGKKVIFDVFKGKAGV